MTLPRGDPTSLGLRLWGDPAAGVSWAGWVVGPGTRWGGCCAWRTLTTRVRLRCDHWRGLPKGHTQAVVLNSPLPGWTPTEGRPITTVRAHFPGSLATDKMQGQTVGRITLLSVLRGPRIPVSSTKCWHRALDGVNVGGMGAWRVEPGPLAGAGPGLTGRRKVQCIRAPAWSQPWVPLLPGPWGAGGQNTQALTSWGAGGTGPIL